MREVKSGVKTLYFLLTIIATLSTSTFSQDWKYETGKGLIYPVAKVNGYTAWTQREQSDLEAKFDVWRDTMVIVTEFLSPSPFEETLSTITVWNSKFEFDRAKTTEGLKELAEKIYTEIQVDKAIRGAFARQSSYDWIVSELKKR